MNDETSNTASDLNAEGWLSSATICPSPNFDARPQGGIVDVLVIHNISLPPGQYGGACVQRFFCNDLDPDEHPYFAEIAGLQVSAHFLIERTGELIQFVATQQRAWHAGESCFNGREKCNDFSIGIELEGSDHEAYTNAQYDALAGLSMRLMHHYPALTIENITGHSDIAPGRKTDPGEAFDWPRYRTQLAALVSAPASQPQNSRQSPTRLHKPT